MFVLISYDIPNDRRRLKVAKILLDYGGERVQRSVFECYITSRNFKSLQERLQRVYDEEEDSIRFYSLCETCQSKMILVGVAKPIEEPGLRII
jgi:CRISPR-associated protein Cas2